ncbi:MAG TPA: diguanylate cyclase [Thermoleophilaceae bacterium]|nr:diguanylate cyclase [Thermoleophilaceae bacterium]
MAVAVLALGALAVWAAIVSQNGAQGLSQAGVQTSGHLRAVQAISLLDTSADSLEEEVVASELAKLRNAQRVLDDALARMENGEVRQARRIAQQAKPIVARLKPAVERSLARPPEDESAAATAAEEDLEDRITELQVLLNDLGTDPSGLLAAKLESVTASERTVRLTAFVLIPLGLGGVAASAWLLSSYRRRSEEVMQAAMDRTAEEARTDQLTGLPNRRALLEDLDARLREQQAFTLVLADLNGFKRYNDTFGHPAGDALLKRLGKRLAATCAGGSTAARLGGDEFCALFDDVPPEEASALVADALREEGEGFLITAASGLATVPGDARSTEAALHVADTRMYAAKARSHPSGEQEMTDAMTRMLDARHPGLGSHVEEVAARAMACAETLGLPEEEVQLVRRAAELHDLGKVAIPEEILTKDSPLNGEEWDFMRRHSIIGERILAGVPSLGHVASIVRSSHERWDGAGYPDGLSGEDIPIGARIVFVADSFCAMTEARPYAAARSVEGARHELAACAGTQFDPAVVAAFLAVIDRRGELLGVPASPAAANA